MTNRTRWLLAVPVVSGMALGFGCQNENRSYRNGVTTATPVTAEAPSAKLDDAAKTLIILRELHGANQTEIDEGKLAADRAQSADVKKFAAEMVSDHTRADQKLTDLAKTMSLDLDETPTNPVQVAMASAANGRKRMLGGFSGSQFDVAYIAPEASEHEMALRLIDEGQKSATGDAKRLLDEMKTTIEMHREHARNLLTQFRFETTAVGGGPATTNGTPGEAPRYGRKDGGWASDTTVPGTHPDMRTKRPNRIDDTGRMTPPSPSPRGGSTPETDHTGATRPTP